VAIASSRGAGHWVSPRRRSSMSSITSVSALHRIRRSNSSSAQSSLILSTQSSSSSSRRRRLPRRREQEAGDGKASNQGPAHEGGGAWAADTDASRVHGASVHPRQLLLPRCLPSLFLFLAPLPHRHCGTGRRRAGGQASRAEGERPRCVGMGEQSRAHATGRCLAGKLRL
jgi:hypothetical protein